MADSGDGVSMLRSVFIWGEKHRRGTDWTTPVLEEEKRRHTLSVSGTEEGGQHGVRRRLAEWLASVSSDGTP